MVRAKGSVFIAWLEKALSWRSDSVSHCRQSCMMSGTWVAVCSDILTSFVPSLNGRVPPRTHPEMAILAPFGAGCKARPAPSMVLGPRVAPRGLAEAGANRKSRPIFVRGPLWGSCYPTRGLDRVSAAVHDGYIRTRHPIQGGDGLWLGTMPQGSCSRNSRRALTR